MKKTLTMDEVINIANNVNPVLLVAPDQTTQKIHYVAGNEKLYEFVTNYFPHEKVTLKKHRFIEEVYEENGVIHFTTKDGVWLLKEADFAYLVEDMCGDDMYGDDELKDYQVCACIKRAAELEAHINDYFQIGEHSTVRIATRIQSTTSYNTYPSNADEFYASHNNHFAVFMVNRYDENCADLGYFPLAIDNETALYLFLGFFERSLADLQKRCSRLFDANELNQLTEKVVQYLEKARGEELQ